MCKDRAFDILTDEHRMMLVASTAQILCLQNFNASYTQEISAGTGAGTRKKTYLCLFHTSSHTSFLMLVLMVIAPGLSGTKHILNPLMVPMTKQPHWGLYRVPQGNKSSM